MRIPRQGYAKTYLAHLKRVVRGSDRTLRGTKCPPIPGRTEGVDRVYTIRDEPPVAVVIRVDNKRSYVYNVKNVSKTKPVPTEMAIATVRFLNGGHYDEPGTA
jgi:hypothetical protein